MNKRKLVYILSPARAGSTLLTYLLSNHHEIATVGELKATAMGNIDEYICSCGEPILECGFWSKVTHGMKEKGCDFDVSNFGTHYQFHKLPCSKMIGGTVKGKVYETIRDLYLGTSSECKTRIDAVTRNNKEIINTICEIQNKSIFLDDSKSPIRLKHLIKADIWDIYVINLIRDGRGVVTSYMKTTNYTITKAVSEWRHICNEIDNVLVLVKPSNVCKIHYEDICNNVDSSLNQLCSFIGCEPFENSQVLDKTNRHILGNSMRLKSTTEITLDERWRNNMIGENLEYFESEVGDLNRKLGYSN